MSAQPQHHTVAEALEAATAPDRLPKSDAAVIAIVARLQQEKAALLERVRFFERYSPAQDCLDGRAQGRGGCGACSVCCKEWYDRAEQAERERDALFAERDAYAAKCNGGASGTSVVPGVFDYTITHG